MEAIAHTIAYDGTIAGETMSGKPLPADRWTSVAATTLVIAGASTEPFFHSGARALADLLPRMPATARSRGRTTPYHRTRWRRS